MMQAGNTALQSDKRLQVWQQRALIVGIVMAIVAAAGAIAMPAMFFPAYLYAYVFWLGIALGSLGLAMMHHLTGGGWGFAIRRILEAAFQTLPLLTLLFIPLLFGLRELYPWMDPTLAATDHVLKQKTVVYSMPWFLLRSVLYFAIWNLLARTLRRWSLEQDRTGDVAITERFQRLCGPGLALYVLSVSLAAIDWIMSLEPHWFSTIFGLIVITGQGLTTFAFAILVAHLLTTGVPTKGGKAKDATVQKGLNPDDPIPNIQPPELEAQALTLERQLGTVWQDLGGLTLAFILLWVYMSFSQYVIIWSGNLPPEISFYLHRSQGGWRWFVWAMVMLHFLLPFFLLLFGGLKRDARRLATVAGALLVLHLLHDLWLVEPKFHLQGFTVTWLDVVTPLAIGGLWLAAFSKALHSAALIPLHDPRLQTEEAYAATQRVREELQNG